MVVMVIDTESKNKDLDPCSVRHNDREFETRVTLLRERKLDWLSKPWPMALLHKQSFG